MPARIFLRPTSLFFLLFIYFSRTPLVTQT